HRRRLRLDSRVHGCPRSQDQQDRREFRGDKRHLRPRHPSRPPPRLRQLRLDDAHDLRFACAAAGQLYADRRRIALTTAYGAHSQTTRIDGAKLTLTDGHAPLTIQGSPLHAIDFTTPVPSAQVKTCVLLAGLQTAGTTTVREAVRTRDHSELALRAFGATLTRTLDSVSISGPQSLHAIEAAVPGDISSAAFFLCAAAIFPGSGLVLDSLGLNPTRATLLDVLTILGARINVLNLEEKNAELVGTVQISSPPEG